MLGPGIDVVFSGKLTRYPLHRITAANLHSVCTYIHKYVPDVNEAHRTFDAGHLQLDKNNQPLISTCLPAPPCSAIPTSTTATPAKTLTSNLPAPPWIPLIISQSCLPGQSVPGIIAAAGRQ
jgi:hypothetical protein